MISNRPFLFWLSCLFAMPAMLAAQNSGSEIRYDASQARFEVVGLGKPEGGVKAKWGYLWEFGDGSFSYEESPVYYYREPLTSVTVKVHLTPFYTAVGIPLTRTKTIQRPRFRENAPVESLQSNKLLEVESNAQNRVIPGHTFRMILQYRAGERVGSAREGYLFLFYNQANPEDLPINYEPFTYLANLDGRYRGEKSVAFTEIDTTRLGESLSTVRNLRQTYRQVRIFRMSDLEAGEEGRIFLSMRSDTRLEAYQDKNRTLSFTALWVVPGASYDPGRQIDVYSLQIHQVHDPNRIRVKPQIAYFQKNLPRLLQYHVDFQNISTGIARDVTIYLPVDRGLDIHSATVGKTRPDCDRCDKVGLDSLARCYELKKVGDTLALTFRNIDLYGKKADEIGWNKKPTKGFAELNIFTESGKKMRKTRTQARIEFLGGKPEETNAAVTRWRSRSFQAQLGWNLAPSASGLENDKTERSLLDQLSLALRWQDVPLSTGFSFFGEAGINHFEFFRDTILSVVYLNEAADLEHVERSRITSFDLMAGAGYTWKGRINAQFGGGLSLPTWATVDLQSSLDGVQNLFDEAKTKFGLLQSRDEVSIFDVPFRPERSPALTGSFTLEAGELDIWAIGLRNQFRWFPDYYHGGCLTLWNWQVYARVRLF
ncbi:MAG: hypothetical protein KDC43_25310 [Saprospiraceae bacterium]|nr:hypothetical protein [Saprospiraceae bacterium]MCB0627140.1 hypothetical protein [Saprospiraceae bacterium]MCB0684737.1 hypothetical protein [Saprospiraceae bacterium]